MKKLLVLSLLSVLPLSGLSEVCALEDIATAPAASSQKQEELAIPVVREKGGKLENVSLDTIKAGSFHEISLSRLSNTDSAAVLNALLDNENTKRLGGLRIPDCEIDDSIVPLVVKVLKSCDWLQLFYFSEREGLNISPKEVLEIYDALKGLHMLEEVEIKVRNDSKEVSKWLLALTRAQRDATNNLQKYDEAQEELENETGDKLDAEHNAKVRGIIYALTREKARWLEAKVGKAIAKAREELSLSNSR